MPDHINIHHPQSREARMRHAIEVAEIKARISVRAGYIADMEIDLTAIFTRIERGDPLSFYYPDRLVIHVVGQDRALAETTAISWCDHTFNP